MIKKPAALGTKKPKIEQIRENQINIDFQHFYCLHKLSNVHI